LSGLPRHTSGDLCPRSPAIQGQCYGDPQTALGKDFLFDRVDIAGASQGRVPLATSASPTGDRVVPAASERSHPSFGDEGDLFDSSRSWSEAVLGASDLFDILDLSITSSDIANGHFRELSPFNFNDPWTPLLLGPLDVQDDPSDMLLLSTRWATCALSPISIGSPIPWTNGPSPCGAVEGDESRLLPSPSFAPQVGLASPHEEPTTVCESPQCFVPAPGPNRPRRRKRFPCSHPGCSREFESPKRLRYVDLIPCLAGC